MTAQSLIANGDTGLSIKNKINSLLNRANMVYAYNTADGASSLAYLMGAATGDVYQTLYFDEEDEGAGSLWKAVASTGLGPVGIVSYRTVFGSALTGTPNALTALNSVGVTVGSTLTINGATVTVVASGAVGNNQINVTARYQDLFLKMTALMASPLGDRCTVEFFAAGRISIQSTDVNNIVTANLTLGGTMGAYIGFPNGTYTFPAGICMEGVATRWQMVPGVNSIVDIRSAGIKCDGVTVADRRKMRALIYGCAALGYKLVNQSGTRSDLKGYLKINRTFDFRRCACDLKLQLGTSVTSTTAVQDGDFFNEAAHLQFMVDKAAWQSAGSDPDTEPTDPNNGVEPFLFVDAAGNNRYAGTSILAAGDASNALYLDQRFDVRGDGNFDFTTRPTAMGPILSNDNSAMSYYDIAASYVVSAVVMQDNLEKSRIKVSVCYSDYMAILDPTGAASPDTIYFDGQGQDCRHWILEEEGSDTSIHWNVHVESRADPGDGSPAFYFRNGKLSRLSGQMRAHNGDIMILVDKAANGGVDTMIFDNFTIIHAYGSVIVRRCRRLSGLLIMKNIGNPNRVGAPEAPALWLGRIGNAGNFRADLQAIDNREGLRIGDASATYHANGLYGVDLDIDNISIGMGSTTFAFDSTGTEVALPTNLTAVVIESMKGGSLTMGSCTGKIVALDGARPSTSGNPIIYAPRTAKKYTHTKTASALIDGKYKDGTDITFSVV